MKSLEIVNKLSKATWYDQETDTLITYISKDMLNQIKADLEVLEIIKKKIVDVGYISALVTQYTDNLYVLERYNGMLNMSYQLTMEELQKLKQWLEE